MNHKYFYETYNWDLYNLHEFAEMTSEDSKEPVIVPSARDIPAISLGFPIHYKLKPWYWWSRFFVNANQIWQDIRLTMPRSQEQYGYDLVPGAMLETVLIVGVLIVVVAGVDTKLSLYQLIGRRAMSFGPFKWRVVLRGLYFLLTIFALKLAAYNIDDLIIEPAAMILLVFNQHIILIFMAWCISVITYPFELVSSSSRATQGIVDRPLNRQLLLRLRFFYPSNVELWKLIFQSVTMEVFIILLSKFTIFFPNLVWSLVVLIGLSLGTLYWQTIFFEFSNAPSSRNEKSRRNARKVSLE